MTPQRPSTTSHVSARPPTLVAALLLAAACTEPPVPTRVVVTPGAATAHAVGETVQFAAEVLDETGVPIPGADIAWSAADGDVATVSASGLATAVGPGTSIIGASHLTIVGASSLEVDPQPARMVAVAGGGQSAPALSVLPEMPAVRVDDSGGTPVAGVRVLFDVVSGGGAATPASAYTDAAGMAATSWELGRAVGPQRLRASVGGGEPETVFDATSTEPRILVPPQTLARPRVGLRYAHRLRHEGQPTGELEWSVASGQLPAGLALDPSGTLSGTPAAVGRSAFTAMASDTLGHSASHELVVNVCPPPLALSPGEVRTYSRVGETLGADGCPPLLPAEDDGLYRIAVVRLGTGTSASLTPSELRAIARPLAPPVLAAGVAARARPELGAPDGDASRPPTSRAAATPSRTDAPDAASPSLPTPLERGLRIADATARFHAFVQAEARRMLRRTGPGAVLPDLSGAAAPGRGGAGTRPSTGRAGAGDAVTAARSGAADTRGAAAEPPPRLGFRFPNFDGNACALPAPADTPALLIGHNEWLAIYQDSVQHASEPVGEPQARQVLDYYEAFGVYVIDEYFGGVSDVNGDSRVNVFVSPRVPDGIAAFVWPGDFLDPLDCASSDQMELVYFNGGMFHALAGAPDDGHYQALGTMVHEVKHVSSLYRRMQAGEYHPSWIEEGGAEIASEMSARRAMEDAGTVAVGEMLTRSHYPPRDGSIITPENYGMLLRLARTSGSYAAPVNSLTDDPPEGGQGQDRHSYYGTSWHFHRFLGDAYGDAANGNEAAFFAALNSQGHSAGVRGIVEVTGRSVQDLLEEYAAAMMLSGTGAAGDAPGSAPRFRTYDFPSATTDLFRPQFALDGRYPWPRTGPAPAPFGDAAYAGDLAPAGIRFHDFASAGAAEALSGIETEVEASGGAVSVVVARIR